MDRYADGDESAFGDVYDLLAPRLHAFFMRQTGKPSLSEDLVQQTLLQIHAARLSYASGSDVIPWAFAIGRRLFLDWLRRTKKEVLFGTGEDEHAALDARVERFANPDEVAMTRELAARAVEELERMPEGHRLAFMLVRDQGLTTEDAAQVLGITPTAVKVRVHRAYEALRIALRSELPLDAVRVTR
jgi:RNA polymerase sigma-70 factor (ECF subfamily)